MPAQESSDSPTLATSADCIKQANRPLMQTALRYGIAYIRFVELGFISIGLRPLSIDPGTTVVQVFFVP